MALHHDGGIREIGENPLERGGILLERGLSVAAAYDAVISLGLIRFINRTVVGIARDGTIAFYKRGTPSTDEIIGALAATQA